MVHIGQHVFYSSEETARLLGVTARTLQKWATDENSRPETLRDLNPIMTPSGKRLFLGHEIHVILGRIYRIEFDANMAEGLLAQEVSV
jgi:hypothetical protein